MRNEALGMAVVLAIAGCDARGPFTSENFSVREAEAMCALLLECCTTTELEAYVHETPPVDYEDCMHYWTRQSQLYWSPPASWVDEGAARECLALIEAQGCGVLDLRAYDYATPCERVWVPLRHTGDPCRLTVECPGGRCVYDLGEQGRCEEPMVEGSPCTDRGFPGVECPWGLYCDEGLICRAALAVGEPCSALYDCLSRDCDETGHCAEPHRWCTGEAAPSP